MRKGDLNRRVTFLRAETFDDGTATITGEPVAIGKRWAKRVDASDGERIRAAQLGQELTTRFTVLSDSLTRSITGRDFLAEDGTAYEVVGTKQIGKRRNDAIEITARAAPDMVVDA